MTTATITPEARQWASKIGIDPIEPLVLEDMGDAFAAQLRAWMGEQKLEITDLARVLGYTRRTAKRIWLGTVDTTMTEVAAIAAWQGRTPTELLIEAERLFAESKKAVAR